MDDEIKRKDEKFWLEPMDFLRNMPYRMGRHLFPRLDITETAAEVRVIADVPGVNPDDIDIYVHGDHMVLSGRMDREYESPAGARPYRYERSTGEFRREFMLPAAVKESEIRAVCKNGVLTITIPKVEEKRSRIKIETE